MRADMIQRRFFREERGERRGGLKKKKKEGRRRGGVCRVCNEKSGKNEKQNQKKPSRAVAQNLSA
jgi:hypothetical protein